MSRRAITESKLYFVASLLVAAARIDYDAGVRITRICHSVWLTHIPWLSLTTRLIHFMIIVRIAMTHQLAGVVCLVLAPLSFVTGCGAPDRSLEANAQYDIFVDSVECAATKANGDEWDADSSGPDIYFNVTWKNNVIFTGKTQDNTLVAHWKPSEMGVGIGTDVAISAESKTLAASITASPGTTVRFEVWDADLASHDEIGVIEIPIEELKLGSNELFDRGAVKKMTIIVKRARALEER